MAGHSWDTVEGVLGTAQGSLWPQPQVTSKSSLSASNTELHNPCESWENRAHGWTSESSNKGQRLESCILNSISGTTRSSSLNCLGFQWSFRTHPKADQRTVSKFIADFFYVFLVLHMGVLSQYSFKSSMASQQPY